MKKKALLLVILMVIFSSFINTEKIEVTRVEYKAGNNTPTEEEALNALKATAYAYYYRGNTIQYSDETFFPDYYYSRPAGQSYYNPPENATIQNTLNLHCISFVYLVYNQAFKNKYTGENYKLAGLTAKETTTTTAMTRIANTNASNPAPERDTNTASNAITVFYKKFAKKGDASKCASCLLRKSTTSCPSNVPEEEKCVISDEANIDLKPGDIIVTQSGVYDSNNNFTDVTSGHAILYLGDDQVINVSQTVNGYNAKKYQFLDRSNTKDWSIQKLSTINPNGSVGFVSLNNNVFKTTNGEINKYIFTSDTYKLAVLRPFNIITEENSNYTLSDSAKVRVNYPDLVINKTSSVNRYDNVYLDEEITYTIKLENKSTATDYNNISITDKVPTNTDFVSITDGTNNNGNLSWTVNVAKGQTKEISYKVKVKNNESIIGSTVTSNNTKVNGMKANTIEHKIKGKFSNDVYNKIVEIATSKVGEEVTGKNIVELVYNELSENKFTEFNNKMPDDYLTSIFDVKTIEIKKDESDNKVHVYDKATNTSITTIQEKDTLKYGYGVRNTYTLKSNKNEMYIDDLFGGVFTEGILDSDSEDQRLMRIKNNSFNVGDVLIIYDEDYQIDNYVAGEKNMYLYIGNGEFVTIDPTTNKVIKLDEKSTETLKVYEQGLTKPREDTHQTDRSRLIESLLGQNSFVVLRPSNIMSHSLITELNEKYDTSVVLPDTLANSSLILYILGGLLIMFGSTILIRSHTKKAI